MGQDQKKIYIENGLDEYFNKNLHIALINYDGGVYGNINQLLIVFVKIK